MSKKYKIDYLPLPHYGNLSHTTTEVSEENLGKVLHMNDESNPEYRELPINLRNMGWHKIYRIYTEENGELQVYYHQHKLSEDRSEIHASKKLVSLIRDTKRKVTMMD